LALVALVELIQGKQVLLLEKTVLAHLLVALD
jgi:hypothetical protein